MIYRAVFLYMLIAVVASTAVAQEQRYALLIGNQNYDRSVGRLKNPRNDIELLAGALEKIRFKSSNIKKLHDGDRVDILSEVEAYADRLNKARPKAIGFFYYSGHGAANRRDRRNYIIPVGVKRLDGRVWHKAISLDEVISNLSGRAADAAHFVVSPREVFQCFGWNALPQTVFVQMMILAIAQSGTDPTADLNDHFRVVTPLGRRARDDRQCRATCRSCPACASLSG